MRARRRTRQLHPPVEDEALRAFPFRKVLHYSALKDRGRGALNEALQQAILWLRQTMGQARIGKGRMAVKRKLEALRDEDAKLPAEQRKYRTLTQEYFRQLCTEAGGVSRPELLLDYLHHAGIVFYREGLFDDRIVLDQAWALEAVYAVFHREKCYRPLRQLRGRFTRTLLEALVWRDYRIEEQELFLSLMKSLRHLLRAPAGRSRGQAGDGIHRPRSAAGSRGGGGGRSTRCGPGMHRAGNWWWISPSAPRRHARHHQPDRARGRDQRLVLEVRRLSVRKHHPQSSTHRTAVEQSPHHLERPDRGEHPGRSGGGAAATASGMDQAGGSSDPDAGIGKSREHPLYPAHPQKADQHRAMGAEPRDAAPERKLEFTPPPSDTISYCVSYAWNDESKAMVDRLCEEAEQRGIKILRDATGLGMGESITRFMKRLGAGDRVFVILSDKYLKSPYCMYELFEVWRNCKAEDEVFRKRIRVYRLPDAKMMGPLERARCAKYWKEQFGELDAFVREEGADLLGTEDFKRYKLMQDFAHHVGDVLALIADTLLPADFDQLVKYGLGDEQPSAAP